MFFVLFVQSELLISRELACEKEKEEGQKHGQKGLFVTSMGSKTIVAKVIPWRLWHLEGKV
jgi:hypothetical protein